MLGHRRVVFQRHVADGVINIKVTHGANKTGGGTKMTGLQVFALVTLNLVPGVKNPV